MQMSMLRHKAPKWVAHLEQQQQQRRRDGGDVAPPPPQQQQGAPQLQVDEWLKG